MTSMPPSGSRNVPSRARKNPAVSSGFSAAIKSGAAKTQGDSTEEKSARRKTPQVRIAKSTYGSLLATKLLKGFLFGLTALVVLYLCFAVTIVRVLPTTSIGLTPVKNITYPGGLIPAEEVVVVDMVESHGSEIVDHFMQSVTPNGNVAKVRVEAGPWAKFSWKEGVVIYKDQILEMTMPNAPESTALQDEYLVTCMSGACVEGQGYVISKGQVLGTPLALKK